MSRAATARAEIAAAVRSAREAAGMSRSDVAARARVAYNVIARVESGSSLPRPMLTARIAKALGVNPRKWLAIVRPGHDEMTATAIARVTGANREATNAAIRAGYLARADTTRSRVTAHRVALGLTGAALAERSGVFPSYVAAMETGLRPPREADTGDWRPTALAIAGALATTCEELWPEHAPKAPRLPRPESPARPDDLYLAAETSASLRAAVAQLPARHAAVIALRFGLPCGPRVLPGAAAITDGDGMHLRDIGALIGVSGERVRQLEGEALRALATTLGDLRP